MPEELNLLPCPACGGEGLFYQSNKQGCHIPCLSCGMRGPTEACPDLAADAWNDLPRALTWTTEPPKEHGWYWLRRLGCKKVKMVDFVYDEHGGSFFGLQIPVTKLNGFECAGPIPTPKEPNP